MIRCLWRLLAAFAWLVAAHGQAAGAASPLLDRTAAPAPDTAAAPSGHRPRIGLVLSGGGARGFAHVGILKALEAARVPVDVIAGTSMGAIIGGLYASGMDPAALEREILAVDWGRLFDDRPPRQDLTQRRKEEDFTYSPAVRLGFKDGQFQFPKGAVSSRSLELLLRRYTLHTRHLPDFDALPTPFRAVATDMETGEPVLLSSGDLAAALRASMSVPGVFSPLEWDGRILGDGGLVNNLPVDVARAMGAEIVIAVNIGTPLARRETLGTALGVTVQMINILTEQNVRRSIEGLNRRDLLLTPDLGSLTAASFDQGPALMAIGERYGASVIEAMRRFALDEVAYAAWQSARQTRHEALLATLPDSLAFVHIEGVSSAQAARLMRQIDVAPGDALEPHRIEEDLGRLVALDDYVQLDYRLAPATDGTGEGLIYRLRDDDGARHQLRLGLDLQTDFQGQGDFRLRLSHTLRDAGHRGAQWRTRVELGATVALGTEWYQPLGDDRSRFTSAYADHELRKIEWFDAGGDPLALFHRRTTRIGADLGWHLGRAGNWGDVRVGAIAARRRSLIDYDNQRVGRGTLRDVGWREYAWRLAWVSDQLDHANFPGQGHRYQIEWQRGHYRARGTATDFIRWEASLNEVFRDGPHVWNLYGRLSRSTALPPGAADEYSLGGFQQLSGYRVGQVAGNALMLLRLGYYRRLSLNPGVARALFVGGTLEAGGAWDATERLRLSGYRDNLRWGSSVYLGADTAIGPVYLGLVHAPRGYTGLYFLLGKP